MHECGTSGGQQKAQRFNRYENLYVMPWIMLFLFTLVFFTFGKSLSPQCRFHLVRVRIGEGKFSVDLLLGSRRKRENYCENIFFLFAFLSVWNWRIIHSNWLVMDYQREREKANNFNHMFFFFFFWQNKITSRCNFSTAIKMATIQQIAHYCSFGSRRSCSHISIKFVQKWNLSTNKFSAY